MQILLVDDDKTILFTVGGFLRQLGHKVREAGSANEALTYLAEDDFTLVLTDIVMPGTSGINLLKEIQGMPLVKCPKVVLFTGYGDLESAIAAIRAGAYDYLLKPIKVEDIITLLRKMGKTTEGIVNACRRSSMINVNRCTYTRKPWPA